MRRRAPLSCLLLALLTACHAPGATTGAPKPKATVAAVSTESTRTVTGATLALSLTGSVGLRAVSKSGLVSDHGAGIISDNSEGIISDNSEGIIANNGGGLIGKTKRQLLATATEAKLVGSQVRVVDAAGRTLVDADGKPLGGRTDGHGGFQFTAKLPKENLVLQVPLSTGGALEALLVPDASGRQTLDVNTASSVGARYVLDRFVQGQAAVLAKLPAAEATTLTADVGQSLAAADVLAAPKYLPAELTGAADTLRAQDAALSGELDKIKALLLGQAQLGAGRAATQVPLLLPNALALDAQGRLLIAENGRIRRLEADGTLTNYADPVFGAVKHAFSHTHQLAVAPDGTLYVSSGDQIFKVGTDNAVTLLVGPGATTPGTLSGLSASAVTVGPMAVTTTGQLVVGYAPQPGAAVAAFTLAADGSLQALPIDLPPGGWNIRGLAPAEGGSLTVVMGNAEPGQEGAQLYSWKPGSPTVTPRGPRLPEAVSADPTVAPDGTLYLVDVHAGVLAAVDAQGNERPVVGPGAPAPADQFLTYSQPVVGQDGTLYVVDGRNNLVRALPPGGAWKTIAGTSGLVQGGSGSDLAVNAPDGVAWDEQGRLLVAEGGSSQVKRYDGQVYEAVVGSTRGYSGDGGPASQAEIEGPVGLSVMNGILYLGDNVAGTLRSVDASNTIRTLAGNPAVKTDLALVPPEGEAPTAQSLGQVTGVAAAPDGTVYFANTNKHQILRLTHDHARVEVVVDLPTGMPFGLALDAQGNLWVADLLGGQIDKIADPSGAHPQLSVVAGIGLAAILDRGTTAETDPEGVEASKAALYLPVGVTVAADGTAYVAEMGTVNLGRATIPGVDANGLGAQLGLPNVYARVRRISPDGHMTTVLGAGGKLLTDPTAEDALVVPAAIALSPDGRLAVVDGGANLIHILPKGSY